MYQKKKLGYSKRLIGTEFKIKRTFFLNNINYYNKPYCVNKCLCNMNITEKFVFISTHKSQTRVRNILLEIKGVKVNQKFD